MQNKSNKIGKVFFYFRIGNLLIFFLLIANAKVIAQSDSLSRTLHRVIQREANKNNFSGSIIVLENTDLVISKSVGFADRKRKIKNEPTTKFVIASVGKLLTRIVILQLVSEGKLSLNDSVSKFLRSFDLSPYNQITTGHLFNHQSGLRDVYVNSAYIDLVKNDEPDFQNKVVEIISDEDLYFTPGAEYKYSNSGYYLLGAIASEIDEKTYEDVITDRIFKPLAMSNSGFSRSGDYVDNQAKPYKFKWFRMKIKERQLDLKGDRPSGAGGQYSTVQDLAKVGFYFLKGKTYGTIITSNFDNMAHELDLKIRNYIIEASKRIGLII